MPYFGMSGARMADGYAERNAPVVEPLAPGVDPMTAIDAETRDAIVNWGATPPGLEDEAAETDLLDRLRGAAIGAGFGAALGFLSLNGLGSHRYRAHAAGPMNVSASLTCAAIGATIGGVAGFARGRNPLEPDTKQAVADAVGATGPSLAAAAPSATHPAFASPHA